MLSKGMSGNSVRRLVNNAFEDCLNNPIDFRTMYRRTDGRHVEADKAFEIMLSKIDESPDDDTRRESFLVYILPLHVDRQLR